MENKFQEDERPNPEEKLGWYAILQNVINFSLLSEFVSMYGT